MKKYITSIVLIFIVINLIGQINNISDRIIPPTPDAQNFIRYGEIPVDISTGVPKIEIPLYDVRCGKLEIPISISYHASGIKVKDIASPVGLGWVLNASGLISKTILGAEDGTNTSGRISNSVAEINNLDEYEKKIVL
jgi:hypothetical protein